MERKTINDTISVSGQISIDDIALLKADGIKTVICNRPDNEDPGQIDYATIEQACKDNGIDFYFMPVTSGNVTLSDGDNFANILENASQPIHAYCRSGTRCTTLWGLAQLKAGTEKNTILQQAAQAGYDLSKIMQ